MYQREKGNDSLSEDPEKVVGDGSRAQVEKLLFVCFSKRILYELQQGEMRIILA